MPDCPLPTPFPALIDGDWVPVTGGESGGLVFARQGDQPAYLKYGTGHVADELTNEMARLRWLEGRWPAPRMLAFASEGGAAWLVTEALSGMTVDAVLAAEPHRAVEIAALLGRYLRDFHALPAGQCPFEMGADLRMAAASRNIELGLVDETDFDAERQGWTAAQVWDALVAARPEVLHRVVTHGDFSTGNLLIADGAVAGMIDVGRLGLADPWQDLAILWSNLAAHGADAQAAMLAAYGIAEPDEARLRFHLLLDELF